MKPVFRKHHLISGESVMIFPMSRSDNEESGNAFMKSKRIAGNPKSIFAKIKNTFGKIKNQNDLSVNRFWNPENIFFVPKNRAAGNNLQENVHKLKFPGNILKIHGNILQKNTILGIISGNKLQEHRDILQKAGKKLQKETIHLKNLGEEMIFVETFRNFAIRKRIAWNLQRIFPVAERGTGKPTGANPPPPP